jgi:hypothetical protein
MPAERFFSARSASNPFSFFHVPQPSRPSFLFLFSVPSVLPSSVNSVLNLFSFFREAQS